MTTFVGLLRAVNVGGTGKLAMRDVVEICRGLGYADARTYIQSGNVIFSSGAGENEVKAALEEALSARLGRPLGVLVRRADELAGVLADNPFKDSPPNRVIVLFLDVAPGESVLADVPRPGGEELALRGREIYIHYPEGQGRSRLKVPGADIGTARNINTVTRLAEMAGALELPGDDSPDEASSSHSTL